MDNNSNQPQQPEPVSSQPSSVVQPPTQFAQQPPVSGGTPYQVPPQKNNTKLFIWIGIGVGVFILIAIALAVTIAMLTVPRAEYNKAYNQMSKVASANRDLSSKVASIQYGLTSSTDTQFKNDLKAAEEAIEKTRSENKELASYKAVRVGDGKKHYEDFAKKLEEYLVYTSDALKSVSDVREASVTCNEANNSSTSNAAATKLAFDSCLAAFKKVSDMPNADVKELVEKMITESENLVSLMEQASKITDPYGAQYDEYVSIRDQVYEAQDNIRDAETDFRSNFERHTDEVDVKDLAEDLGDFLIKKSRG